MVVQSPSVTDTASTNLGRNSRLRESYLAGGPLLALMFSGSELAARELVEKGWFQRKGGS
jgi:hypothetical protein